jgi:hypothetical protein
LLSASFSRHKIVNFQNKGGLKSLLLPGGVVLFVAAGLLQGGILPISGPAIDFYYYAVFMVGSLLAWRFHASRVLLSLGTLLLAHRALEFFSNGRVAVLAGLHLRSSRFCCR